MANSRLGLFELSFQRGLGTKLAAPTSMPHSSHPTNLLIACAVLALFAVDNTASADPRSAELRFQLFAPSYRWSPSIAGAEDYNQAGRKSLYFSPGIGGRFFPRHGSHGVLAQFDYRFDAQTDDPWCLFSSGPCPSSKIEYAVAHAGYAYRHIVTSPRRPDRRFWAFTPHASVAAGWAKNEPAAFGIPSRSPVVGGRVGFDVDLHFNRFFMGWSIRYEALMQTQGPIGWSHFFAWNAMPLFQMGVDLGAERPDENRMDGYPSGD